MKPAFRLRFLGAVQIERHDAQAAHEYGLRVLEVLQKTDGHRRQGHILSRLGFALENLGRVEEAGERYREALKLRREAHQRHLAIEPLAGLARYSLLQGDL